MGRSIETEKDLPMFIVKLRGKFWKSDLYVETVRGCHVISRSRKRATRMTREQAERVAAKCAGGPNQYVATVVED